MAMIQYINMKALSDTEQQQLQRLVDKFSPKLERALPNMSNARLHVKKYKKSGKRAKISIRMQAMVGNKVFEGHANDWDVKTVAHKVFDDMENQLEHHLHTHDQKPKNLFRRTMKNLTPEFAQKLGIRINDQLASFWEKKRK